MSAERDLLDEQSQLLLLEYERSSEFCNHVDDVRNVITSFYLTVIGAALFFVDKFASGEARPGPLGPPSVRALLLLVSVSFLGLCFVMTLARLRKVQLERYRLMNGILDAVLIAPRRAVIPFRDAHLQVTGGPLSRRGTGSYIWTVVLMFPAAAFAGVAAFLAVGLLTSSALVAVAFGVVTGLAGYGVLDRTYLRMSGI